MRAVAFALFAIVTLATGAGPAMAGAHTSPASSLEDAGRLVDLLLDRLGSVGAELAQQLQGRKAPASAEEAGRLVDLLVDRLGSLGAELGQQLPSGRGRLGPPAGPETR